MTDLKPCPFCGGEATLVRFYRGRMVIADSTGVIGGVKCYKCGAQITNPRDALRAVKKWNKRKGESNAN